MKCQKCRKEFEEKDLHESHDIPKYLGGTDKDGRHLLCKTHHELYDKRILIKCLNLVGEKLFDDSEIIGWQKELSRQPESLKKEFRKIAKSIKEDFFNGRF